jgi:hypothetical protein
VVSDKHISKKFDTGEIEIIFSREDKGGTGGEKGKVERVEVFKRGRDTKKQMRANEGRVGVGAPVKGGDRETNSFFDGVIHISGENKEKHMIGEERDNKNVYEKDLFVEGEGAEDRTVLGEAVEGFRVGVGEDPLQGHVSTDGDAKVNSLI